MDVRIVGRILPALGEGRPVFSLVSTLPAPGLEGGKILAPIGTVASVEAVFCGHLPPGAHKTEVVASLESYSDRSPFALEGRELGEELADFIVHPVSKGAVGDLGELGRVQGKDCDGVRGSGTDGGDGVCKSSFFVFGFKEAEEGVVMVLISGIRINRDARLRRVCSPKT